MDLSDLSGKARRKFLTCRPRVAPDTTKRLSGLEVRRPEMTAAVFGNPDRLMVDISLSASLVIKATDTSPFAKPLSGKVKLT